MSCEIRLYFRTSHFPDGEHNLRLTNLNIDYWLVYRGMSDDRSSDKRPDDRALSLCCRSVRVFLILRFGPRVVPDPTVPLQKHLTRNQGRTMAPLNEKVKITAIKIVKPGAYCFCSQGTVLIMVLYF